MSDTDHLATSCRTITSIPYGDHGRTFDILESPRFAVLFHLRIELGDSVLFDIVAQFAIGRHPLQFDWLGRASCRRSSTGFGRGGRRRCTCSQ